MQSEQSIGKGHYIQSQDSPHEAIDLPSHTVESTPLPLEYYTPDEPLHSPPDHYEVTPPLASAIPIHVQETTLPQRQLLVGGGKDGYGYVESDVDVIESVQQSVHNKPLQDELATLTMESDDAQSPLKSTTSLAAHMAAGTSSNCCLCSLLCVCSY